MKICLSERRKTPQKAKTAPQYARTKKLSVLQYQLLRYLRAQDVPGKAPLMLGHMRQAFPTHTLDTLRRSLSRLEHRRLIWLARSSKRTIRGIGLTRRGQRIVP